jgi:hypothetical protein
VFYYLRQRIDGHGDNSIVCRSSDFTFRKHHSPEWWIGYWCATDPNYRWYLVPASCVKKVYGSFHNRERVWPLPWPEEKDNE